MSPIYIVVFMFVVFYWMVLRPQRKAQRAKKEMLAMLKKGDEIITIGGLMGTIRKLGDDWVELEIANRTRVYLKRWAVGSLVSEEEEDDEEYEHEDDAVDVEPGDITEDEPGDTIEDEPGDETDDETAVSAEEDEAASETTV